jgi:hypothetical protein
LKREILWSFGTSVGSRSSGAVSAKATAAKTALASALQAVC